MSKKDYENAAMIVRAISKTTPQYTKAVAFAFIALFELDEDSNFDETRFWQACFKQPTSHIQKRKGVKK